MACKSDARMRWSTVNALKESGLLGGPQASFEVAGEPKLTTKHTFLTFKFRDSILGEDAGAFRPRANSDHTISYGWSQRALSPCDLSIIFDDDSDGETLSTIATSGIRSRTSSNLDSTETESVCSEKTHMSWRTSSSIAACPPPAKPPGDFTAPWGVATAHQGLESPDSAVAMAACRGQLSELSIAALRAEVEAGLRDEAKGGKRAKKAFSLAVVERISEQQKLTSLDVPQLTSIQMRQLPASMTRSMLVATLNAEGFKGKFDFVYVPIHFSNGEAFGYAFLNCITPDVALEVKDHFSNFTSWVRRVPTNESVQPCAVVGSSEFQGFLEHVERYRNSPVMHSSVPDDHKPALFVNGLRVPFPGPTRRICAPRARKTRLQGHPGVALALEQ